MNPPPDVDSTQFRQLCGLFPTGVVIVTTKRSDGSLAGMTANSFTSVSLDPPLVSISVERSAEMHEAILAAPYFNLNILQSHQEDLSRRFAATPLPTRFDGVGYQTDLRGLPVLNDALATIECARWAEVPAGDHTVVIGRVLGGCAREGRPLLYYRGGYQDSSSL